MHNGHCREQGRGYIIHHDTTAQVLIGEVSTVVTGKIIKDIFTAFAHCLKDMTPRGLILDTTRAGHFQHDALAAIHYAERRTLSQFTDRTLPMVLLVDSTLQTRMASLMANAMPKVLPLEIAHSMQDALMHIDHWHDEAAGHV